MSLSISVVEFARVGPFANNDDAEFGFVVNEVGNGFWFTQKYPGESGTENIVWVPLGGSPKVLESDPDFGFKHVLSFLRVTPNGAKWYRFAGYGEIDPNASTLWVFNDDGSIDKIIDTYSSGSNPNLDNNFEKCFYHAAVNKLVCSTAGGGRFIKVVDVDTLTIEARVKFLSSITAPRAYHTDIVTSDRYMYVVGGVSNTSYLSDNPLTIARVDIEDFIENYKSIGSLDELGSFTVVATLDAGINDWPTIRATIGTKVWVQLVNSDGSKSVGLLDVTSGGFTSFDALHWAGRCVGKLMYISNDILYLMDSGGNIVGSTDVSSIVSNDYYGVARMWYPCILSICDKNTHEHVFYAVSVNGKIPRIIIDYENMRVRVVDAANGAPIAGASVAIYKTVLGNPLFPPIGVEPVARSADSDGYVDFSDIVEPYTMIMFEVVGV